MSRSRSPKLADAVEAFVVAATAWGEADRSDDSKLANSLYKRVEVSLRRVMDEGAAAVERVVALVDDSNPFVARWAATFALRYQPRRAEIALRRLAKAPGLNRGAPRPAA